MKEKYVLHDPLEPGFYLCGYDYHYEHADKVKIITTAADKFIIKFENKEEAEMLAKFTDMEVKEIIE
ncbi:hypothetical protein BKP56_07095 [Marinilactibacillus sp. 15R]|nr:hypothetical protein BKP56_07095 [Marinilactibacillus sp. 15R]